LYEYEKRRGINQKAINQHAIAIEVSGSRLNELDQISVPTLVIHGNSDPLVNVAHSLKYAPLIPNSKTLYIDGMGHDIPALYLDEVHDAILSNLASTKEIVEHI